MSDPAQTLERFGAAFLRLDFALGAAAESQWQPALTVRPREDTSERSRGVTSDPTWRAASDERRLRLRARVREAERVRGLALHQMAVAGEALRAALTDLQVSEEHDTHG